MKRLSLYKVIHKAIRALEFDLVVRSGRVEWRSREDVAAFRKQLENAFALLASHAAHEERVIAPMLEAAAISTARLIGGAHRDQDSDIHNLMLAIDSIDPDAADAPAKGHALVVGLSRFVGESLAHMADEEELAMPALWQAYDDVLLDEAYKRILAGVAPDEMATVVQWIVPSINHAERMEFLGARPAVAAQK